MEMRGKHVESIHIFVQLTKLSEAVSTSLINLDRRENSEFIIPQDNKSIFRYIFNVLMKRSSAFLTEIITLHQPKAIKT